MALLAGVVLVEDRHVAVRMVPVGDWEQFDGVAVSAAGEEVGSACEKRVGVSEGAFVVEARRNL